MAIFLPLNSKYGLDIGDIDVILSRDTPSNDGEQMCLMILKSHNERHSYGPDKLVPPARQPTSPPADICQSNNWFFPSEKPCKKSFIVCISQYQTFSYASVLPLPMSTHPVCSRPENRAFGTLNGCVRNRRTSCRRYGDSSLI
ncbi:hypothetical protein DPMN_101176 [Dreissena polymorpha]|uniref:Uncharacterized protein n=1 Tax=Dreissena polymorpha TaxID=45954 RepID=A0A9D4LI96_DREPO|nr:hypothetical protein DPMN_101176 [Dreissena polymorpha]